LMQCRWVRMVYICLQGLVLIFKRETCFSRYIKGCSQNGDSLGGE
jgi:hypothetical protein